MKSYPLDIEILYNDECHPLIYSKGIHDKERFLESARKASMDWVALLNKATKENVVYCYGRYEWRGKDRCLTPYEDRPLRADGKHDTNFFPMTCIFLGGSNGF